MKVVINNCYGGFGLSPRATKRLAELQGRKCYFFVHPINNNMPDLDKLVRVSMTEAEKAFMWHAYDIPNVDEVLPSHEDWQRMTNDEARAANELHDKHCIETGSALDRADPNLVKVVKELGKKANGKFADLKIVTIPDGVDFEIDKYDGLESIHEKHRSWG